MTEIKAFIFTQEERFFKLLLIPYCLSITAVLDIFEDNSQLKVIFMVTFALFFLVITIVLSKRKFKLTITSKALIADKRKYYNKDIKEIRVYRKKGKIVIIRGYLIRWNIFNFVKDKKDIALTEIEDWAEKNGVLLYQR